jgi:LacI family transcriptional regulator
MCGENHNSFQKRRYFSGVFLLKGDKCHIGIVIDVAWGFVYNQENRANVCAIGFLEESLMPTIREVAKQAGVSPTTVSHVVNQTRFVSEDVTVRVHKAMDDLGYRPNALARSLRRGETKTIGLILPDSSNPYFAEIGKAIEEKAFSYGYSQILCNTNGDQEKEKFYMEVLLSKQVDGIIFVSAGDSTQAISQLINRRIPVVVVDRYREDLPVDIVFTNNYQGGFNATQHLIDLGHTRIGIIRGPSNLNPSMDRLTGYCDALIQNDLEIDEELIRIGNFHPASGMECTRALLSLEVPPTAIFACNDLMAIGAMRAAAEFGLNIPADLALVGFDNIELSSFTVPLLSTIDQRKDVIGQTAVDMLIERINDPKMQYRQVVLENELIIRESSRSAS